MPIGPYQTKSGPSGLTQPTAKPDTPIYLDHNATGPTDPDVVAAMMPFFTEVFANPSSSHALGERAAGAMRQARRQVQALLGAAEDSEIVFTSGGSEADNLALYQAAQRPDGRDEILISAVEHPAILNTARALEQTFGLKVHRIGVDGQGRIDRAAFEKALGPKTALVSVMWANNETGNLYPVQDLAERTHAAGALFHCDAVQAVGKIPMALKDSAIDMLSVSGHKFHGPKGIGVLYVRKGVRLRPLIHGGRQERGRRAGTENLPAIVGLGKTCEIAQARMANALKFVEDLRNRFEAAILSAIPAAQVLGDVANRLVGTSLIAFDGAESEVVLHHLDKADICASAGSACQAGTMEPSHVVRAMGVNYTLAQGTVRFSFDASNTQAEIAYVLSVLPAIVAKAREISPFAPPNG